MPTIGQMSLAPDNEFHQFNVTGGYNFDKTTRLTLNASRGIGTQDQAFLPYMYGANTTTSTTVVACTAPGVPAGCGLNGTYYAGGVISALPVASLGGEVITTNLYTKLTAQPIDKLKVLASYKFDDRDNKTPQQYYSSILTDGYAANTQATTTAEMHTYSVPRDIKQQTGTLEADYTFLPRTALKLGVDHQEVDRTFMEVDKTKENTYRAGLRSNTLSQWGLTENIGYVHSERTGSNYTVLKLPTINEGGATAAGFDPLTTGWGPEQAGQKKFMLADRKRDKVNGSVSYTPPALSRLTLQAALSFNDDKYNTLYGMTESKGWAGTLDASYALMDAFVVNAYYTHEDTKSNLPLSQASATITDNLIDLQDQTNTIGVGIKNKGLMDGRLELGGDATIVLSKTKFEDSFATLAAAGVTGANPYPSAAFPDVTNKAYTLGVSGRYELDKNAAIKAGYTWQKVESKDWAYNLGIASAPALIGDNEQPPNYTVQFFGLSYQRTFW